MLTLHGILALWASLVEALTEKAVLLCDKTAAAHGSLTATRTLGIMYAKGEGTAVKIGVAQYLFAQVAGKGCTPAMPDLRL